MLTDSRAFSGFSADDTESIDWFADPAGNILSVLER